MRIKSITAAIALSFLTGGITSPLLAQVNIPAEAVQPSEADIHFLARAKNLARQAGINANGGLNAYRPELSMFGPALESPYTRNADGSVTFKFLGAVPGAAVFDKETEAIVNPDSSVNVVYNGPVRGAIGGGDLPGAGTQTVAANTENSGTLAILDDAEFPARARNLARQRGINENGGLGLYRPEANMFGPSAESPHVVNADGSVTFTFQGGAPTAAPTLETEVMVTRAGEVSLLYNGGIR